MLAVSWAAGWVWPGPGFGTLGLTLIAAGLALMLAAVLTMAWARTTFVPRRNPTALVTAGVFRLSRNPIYLGDALVLLGAILWWGAWLALPLVPLFMIFITRRYIRDEEARLHAGFGAEYEAWSSQVPRWFWRV